MLVGPHYVRRRTSLMSSSFTSSALLVLLGWFVKWEMCDRTATVFECCFQDLFKTSHNILMFFPSRFFSNSFVKSVATIQLYEHDHCMKNSHFFFISERSDFYMVISQPITLHTISMHNVDIVFNRWDIATGLLISEVYHLMKRWHYLD